MRYQVTLPIANDLPALSVVHLPVIGFSSDDALYRAEIAVRVLGYQLDNTRGASVEVD
jgi:hypothetical protein